MNRLAIIYFGLGLNFVLLSCSDNGEKPIINSGVFTVDGIEFPIDKAILLSSCAYEHGDEKYAAILLLMPQSTATSNITCDDIEFSPARPDWISIGLSVSHPNALDGGSFATTPENDFPCFARLHAREDCLDCPLNNAWLDGEIKVTKIKNAYSIGLDFEFQQYEKTKTLKGTFQGNLIQN